MAKKQTTPLELGKRERQIYETVLALNEASVSEVLAKLDCPPSYSAVRATLSFLVEKKWLKHRQVGQKYLYRAAVGQQKAQRNEVARMLSTYFRGSATDAVAALLDVSAANLTDDQLNQMQAMIEDARKESQS